MKVATKFKRKSSIPTQISLSKNDNIQIHQYMEMLQDLNPNLSTTSQSRISCTYPQLGDPCCHRGPKFSPVAT